MTKNKKQNERIMNIISFILVVLLAAGAMLPIWWIFRSSLMTNAELYAWPPRFCHQNGFSQTMPRR